MRRHTCLTHAPHLIYIALSEPMTSISLAGLEPQLVPYLHRRNPRLLNDLVPSPVNRNDMKIVQKHLALKVLSSNFDICLRTDEYYILKYLSNKGFIYAICWRNMENMKSFYVFRKGRRLGWFNGYRARLTTIHE